MTLTGVVRGRRVELDGEATLPEGTRVRVIPDEAAAEHAGQGEEAEPALSLGEWLKRARQTRSRMPMGSDSVEILREIREERSNR